MRSGATAAVVCLGICLAPFSQARAVPLFDAAAHCQQQIGVAGRMFKKVKLVAWQRCLNGLLLGTGCDATARDAAIAKAKAKFLSTIGKKCTDSVLFRAQTTGVGFARTCDLDPAASGPAEDACRTLDVTDAASLGECLACWTDAELNEVLRALYPCAASEIPAGSPLDCGAQSVPCATSNADIACVRAAAKAGVAYFLSRDRLLGTCLERVREGRIAAPCPDARTSALLLLAEGHELAVVSTCDAVPPWWPLCPFGPSDTCDQSVDSVSQLGECIRDGGNAVAEELLCQEYPIAVADGVACPGSTPLATTPTPIATGTPLAASSTPSGTPTATGTTVLATGTPTATSTPEVPTATATPTPISTPTATDTTMVATGTPSATATAELPTPTLTPTVNSTSSATPGPAAVCGNGVLEAGEQCDDGNNFNLDGCDSNCRYEVIARWDALALQGTAAPAALGCAPATNRFGAQVFTSTALGQLNPQMQTDIDSAASNVMMQFLGLDDLTGVADGDGFTLGLLDATPDPAKGAWPGNDPEDWWFLADYTSVAPTGLPTNVLTNGTLAARNMTAGPTDSNIALPVFGNAAPLRLRSTVIHATLNGNPPPNVPAPPPSQLAAGLTVFQTITGNGTGQGLCGNITVDSLAQIPVPPSLAQGGSTACGNCAGSHTYTACTGGALPGNSLCNSLLDVIVGGCKVVACFATAVNPEQPDVAGTDGDIDTLTLGPSNKIPVTATMGNDDAYSAYFTFTANRQHFTSQTCTVTADCQTGKTCTAGTCQ